jgi:TolB-like protein
VLAMKSAMRRWTVASLAVVGFTFAQPTAGQTGPAVIAVLPFEDRGSYGQDKEVFRALALGIPATLASELSGHSNVRLADRARVTQALRSQDLGPNAQVDASTAARVAQQVGARYAITGTFADFYGTFRLDGRIVDAGSGEILRVVTNNDPKLQNRADLYRIIQMVAHKMLGEVSPAAMRGGPPQADMRLIPTEALTQYSLGLLYEGQGDRNKASEHYDRALTVLPDYPEAREALRRVRGT